MPTASFSIASTAPLASARSRSSEIAQAERRQHGQPARVPDQAQRRAREGADQQARLARARELPGRGRDRQRQRHPGPLRRAHQPLQRPPARVAELVGARPALRHRRGERPLAGLAVVHLAARERRVPARRGRTASVTSPKSSTASAHRRRGPDLQRPQRQRDRRLALVARRRGQPRHPPPRRQRALGQRQRQRRHRRPQADRQRQLRGQQPEIAAGRQVDARRAALQRQTQQPLVVAAARRPQVRRQKNHVRSIAPACSE